MAERPFGHESPGVNTGRVLTVLGALSLFVVIAVIVLHFVLRDAAMPHRVQVVDRSGVIPPAPRLQPHPDRDIASERAQKQGMLSQYAWTDPSRHYARIPIQRAMQLYVQQHAAPADPKTVRNNAAPGASQ